MVEKFGFSVSEMALLFLVNSVLTIYLAPRIGRLVNYWGEKRTLTLEYSGLIVIFVAYAFAESAVLASVLYIIDHIFFAMAIAIKTYFQKIADPADIASSSGVSFTISHIVAIVIPATFGFLWLTSPTYVFLAGAAMAAVSLVLAFLVPRNPELGNESIIFRVIGKPQAAE